MYEEEVEFRITYYSRRKTKKNISWFNYIPLFLSLILKDDGVGKMRALGFGKAPTRGIVNGEVVSRDELVLRFVDAIATAETKADERASKVIFSMQFETLDKEKAKNEIIKTFKQVSFKRSDIEFSEKPFVVKI